MSWHHCPKCGAKAMCLDSRPAKAFVRRRYVCKGKGKHRFSTVETLTPARYKYRPVQPLSKRAQIIDKMLELIDDAGKA